VTWSSIRPAEPTCYSSAMPSSQSVIVQPAVRVAGRVRPPGDKSISHRYAMLAAIADGASLIEGYSTGADCASTLSCLQGLGVAITTTAGPDGRIVHVTGRGVRGLVAPAGTLDAGNSGSTMRMLAGILAAHPFSTTLTGDSSLCRRPMRRIITPLERMGAVLSNGRSEPGIRQHRCPESTNAAPLDCRPAPAAGHARPGAVA